LAEGDWQRVLAEPPFVPPPHAREPRENDRYGRTVDLSSHYRPWNYWMMSQQVGSPSYLVFSAGLCLAIYTIFLVLADFREIELSVLRTLGVNSLIGYLLHSVVADFVQEFMPRDVPAFVMWIGFAIFFTICWWMLRALEKKGIFLKL
jgi:peptidoglycan/LPS O-acetylase OafA/YrhL